MHHVAAEEIRVQSPPLWAIHEVIPTDLDGR
jgi:hypothetical protein